MYFACNIPLVLYRCAPEGADVNGHSLGRDFAYVHVRDNSHGHQLVHRVLQMTLLPEDVLTLYGCAQQIPHDPSFIGVDVDMRIEIAVHRHERRPHGMELSAQMVQDTEHVVGVLHHAYYCPVEENHRPVIIILCHQIGLQGFANNATHDGCVTLMAQCRHNGTQS